MTDACSRRETLEALQAEVAELRPGDDAAALEALRGGLDRRRAEASAEVAALEQGLTVERARLQDALEAVRFRAALRAEPERERSGWATGEWQATAALALGAAGYLTGRVAADESPGLPWLLAAAAIGVVGFVGLQAGRLRRAQAQAEQLPRP
jgi:hypothetical protein